MKAIKPERLSRLRATSQLMHRPLAIRHPRDVVREAGPVQAQEPRAAKLAFRARSRGLTAADVDHARNEERSLLRAWMMRKTVHLIAAEDAGWIVPLFAEGTVRWSRKRLGDHGLDAAGQERAMAVLHRAVADDGPLTRPELAQRLERAGFQAPQEIKVHLWLLATLDGELCLGPDRGDQACLVLTEDWLGKLERRSREDSLAELARRYLRGYGPAGERDFARWAGLSIGDSRIGFKRIAAELVEARVGETIVFSLARHKRRTARGPVVRLLGAFDNYNMGYESRDFAVAPKNVKRMLPGGGIVRPTIAVDGRFAGTWSSKRSGRKLSVQIEPFEVLAPGVEEAIAQEISDIGRFENLTATLS